MKSARPFLLSIDVEDPRLGVAGGDSLKPRVPAMVDRWLDFLAHDDGRATFFIVGEVARRHPEIVARIAAAGHEVGCHSDRHIPLDRQNPEAFRADLERNLEALRSAGVRDIVGYRAPIFSLTERTVWAYPILADLGFAYSSSVVPARNPLFGWPQFGRVPRLIEGIVEWPISLFHPMLCPLPLGGVYFRVLPRLVMEAALRRHRRSGRVLAGYFHPYDLDTEQYLTAPGIRAGGLYDRLLRANRSAVLLRLDRQRRLGFRFESYRAHADRARQSFGDAR
jgi:polysaccharide deacetylase family protein (PEP-CTERM system associated)